MTPGKRSMDLGLALILSVVLLPVGLGVAVLILLRDGRPVFYVSERMRSVDQGFMLWKFRTMRPNSDDGRASGGHKAERITPMGRVLRRTRMDELPQLWNVFRGDISFVGPRPPVRDYVERFPGVYREVLRSRPGITGLATLYYHRHEESLLAKCRSAQETDDIYTRRCVPAKARLDLIYARRRSLTMDLRLIVMTAARAAGRDLRSCGFGGRRR